MRLPHSVTIQRSSDGSDDDRGVAVQTWATLAVTPAFVQPKSAKELAQLSQSGPVTATHTIYLYPTDITEADRIAYDGLTYELDGIRDEAGLSHHLRCDAHTVEI